MLRYLVFPAALLAAACTPPAGEQSQPPTAEQAEPAAPAAAVSATGTVTAVNAAAGTISIDHDPIAAVNWPAMSMQFTAEDATILQGVAVGDRVAFDLKSASEPETIVSLRKQ